MDEIFVPALALQRASEVRWTSITRAVRLPEECWPAELLEQPIIRAKIRKNEFALISDPEAAETVLGGDGRLFPKWFPIYRRTAGKGTGPNSIFVTSGEHWRFIRGQLAPLFAPNAAAPLVEQARAAAERLVETAMGADGGGFDACEALTEAALDVIWRTLTGDLPEGAADAMVSRAALGVSKANAKGDVSGASPWIETLAAVAATRPPGPLASRANPLLRLMAGGAAGAGRLSEGEAQGNLLALLYAGQETTALSSAWALWLIGQSPRLQRQMQQEIDEACGDRPVDLAAVRRLPRLTAVLKETMRLLPPAVVTVRQAASPVQLAGQHLPAGTIIAVCFYALHRHRAWWRDPDRFDAERFAPGSDEPRRPTAFLPFSAGSHTCLAAKNSMWEILALIATVLRKATIETVAPREVGVMTAMVLHPNRPLRIIARAR